MGFDVNCWSAIKNNFKMKLMRKLILSYVYDFYKSIYLNLQQKIKMGCASSEGEFDQPLSQDLENQMKVVSFDKKDNEIDRFQSNKPQNGFDDIFTAEEETDEQFMAVKPWIGALVAPTNKPNFVAEAPAKKLALSFVNGFKIEDSRQNMFWGKNPDEIIYCAAAVGIVMNANTLAQRYMGTGLSSQAKGHTDDIMSLGVCPNRKLVVTGSLGARPDILLWDSESMTVLARTKLGRNTRAVSSIRFSKDGKLFFCTDKHNDSNVYCFNASDASLLGQNKCGSDPVFDAETGANNVYAVATKRGLWFFQYANGVLDGKKGIFNGHPMTAQICITFNAETGTFYSGTTTGDIFQWAGNTCSKSAKVHQGSVRGLQWSNGYLLSSGSKDNLLKVSKGYEIVKTFEIPSFAVSLDYFNKKFLVATSCGKILTINETNGEKKQVMQAHSTGQTWGLAISPQGTVYTTADDNKLIEFNPKTKKVVNIGIINEKPGKKYRILGASTLSTLPPNQQARGVAASQSGHVAIGLNNGELSVRTAKDLNKVIFSAKDAAEWIQVLKYSPSQDKLAVGSHDNNIYIYSVNGDTYTKIATCTAHKSFITNLDWSCDGKYIQSNCGAYEYLFFDAETGKQVTSGASQLRDQPWATYSVKLGWWVQGIFPKDMSGDHVNGVDRNHSKDIIATGDDWGFVNLYRNPALKGAKCLAYRAHSSHVVRVMFDAKDEYLYSVGGYDKTLMMWKYS